MRFDLVTLAVVTASATAVLTAALFAYEALRLGVAFLRRRRRTGGAAVGVVVDRGGRTLGTYLDPLSERTRRGRLHEPGSPWTPTGYEERPAFAWEGVGSSEEEARWAANRLRRRHLQLVPWMAEDVDVSEDSLFSRPWTPTG